MENNIKSIRPFIGAKDFKLSRSFYQDMGFKETVLTNTMSLFQIGNFAFYLQDAYVKDWIDNSMLFLEVANVNHFWKELIALNLTNKYKEVKIVPIKEYDWGKECFIHDPSGILGILGVYL